jgi:hypothetical protein
MLTITFLIPYFIIIKETPGSAGGLPEFDSSGNVSRKGWRQLRIMKDVHNEQLALECGHSLGALGVSGRRRRAVTEEGRGRKKTQAVGIIAGVGWPPEGPCGFEPLHL